VALPGPDLSGIAWSADLVGDDPTLGAACWPAIKGLGKREVIGVLDLKHVLVPWPLGRDKRCRKRTFFKDDKKGDQDQKPSQAGRDRMGS